MFAVAWHYWLAVGTVFIVVVAALATTAGYLAKVTRTKYPPRDAKRR